MQVFAERERTGGIAGKHLIIEAVGSEQHILNDEKLIRASLIAAARAGDFSIVEVATHKFVPRGVTGYARLEEAHFAIHTWPEHNYAAIDVFGCGDKSKIIKAYNILVERFNPSEVKKKDVKRGF